MQTLYYYYKPPNYTTNITFIPLLRAACNISLVTLALAQWRLLTTTTPPLHILATCQVRGVYIQAIHIYI